MTTVIVQHGVTDYDVWRPIFDEHGANRAAHGGTSATVYRGAEDANAITVVMDFPTLADAQAFASDPSLKEAMGRAGVTGPPQISFVEAAS
ncbi:MAG: DUF1330 domain-containing protein [Acidimicrobiales bacterium]